ncbi:MAG: hypothetical protein RBS89_05855 [Candidatus Delongbacteria bacterium]|jgi:hypothetical protein|nr:hypothetical protein [Candidatus Delongbacteria bacterium]
MQIALTKKVQDYLGIKTLESYKDQDYFITDWGVNYFTLHRKKIFVFMNRKTKFIVIVPCTNKKNLIYDFDDKLELELIKAGVPQDKLDEMYLGLDNIRFIKNDSKSFTDSQVQMIKDIESYLYKGLYLSENTAEMANTTLVKFHDGYDDPVIRLFDELDLAVKLIKYEELKNHPRIKSN